MNRKGDILMVFVDIIFLLALVLIFWKVHGAFTQPNESEGIGTRQASLLHTYAVSEQMLLYVDEAAKYAAYESLASVMGEMRERPGTCDDTYAEYASWTTDVKRCFPAAQPDAQDSVYERFKQDMRANLRASLAQYPGFPVGVEYSIDLNRTNGLQVRGTPQQQVTLPIVAAKNSRQNEITSLLLQDNIAKAVVGEHPDATIEGVTLNPSTNRKVRAGTITYIILSGTNTTNSDVSMSWFLNGAYSTHYFIDDAGKITQFVPESFTTHFLDCKECTIPNMEEKAISISLQNKGAIAFTGGQCPDGYALLTRRKWCGNAQCDDLGKACFGKFTDAQLEALERLLGNIVQRDDLQVQNILLAEQVANNGNPGPALGRGDQMTWLADLKTRLAAAKAQAVTEVVEQEESVGNAPSAVSADSMDVRLPVDHPVLTSCFGSRDLPGSTEHFGIDFRVAPGTEVHAIADGEIVPEYVCNGWVGECACSSRDKSCPLKCSQLCAGRGQGYGNAVLVKHPNGYYSYYTHLSKILISSGQVKKGDIIGLSGNTGSSTGPHLHFAVFPSPFSGVAKKNGINPLCIFPEEQLKTLALASKGDTNCNLYSSLSHSDPALAAQCSGVAVGRNVPTCGQLNQQPISPGGNPEVEATLNAIRKQPGLLEAIQQAGADYKVDYRLIIAQLARESNGKPDLVTFDGGVGISQFTDISVSQASFKGIGDVSRIKACKCPSGYRCSPAQASCNLDDPRLNAVLSVRAQAKLMSELMGHYSSYPDKMQFALAEYNWGPRTKSIGIKTTETLTGKKDVAWADVAPHTPAVTQKYVSLIMQYYAAQGGSASNVYSDIECDNFNVKELGTYTFTPAFTVTVPNLLTAYDRTAEFAKKAYELCDGRDNSDPAICLAKQEEEFSRQSNDLKVTACEEGADAALDSLLQAMEDCENNEQDLCACAWKPPKAQARIVVRNGGALLQGPADTDSDMPPALTQAGQQSVQIILGERSQLLIGEKTYDVDEFRMMKDKGSIVWITPDAQVPACGDYKTDYHVCVEVKHPIPLLSKGTRLQTPTIKFALHLNDSYAPAPVQNAQFLSFYNAQTFTFSPSPSEDVSYYLVQCNGGKPEFMNGREDGKRIDHLFNVLTCNGAPFSAEQSYKLKVTPVDLASNTGTPVSCDTQAQQAAQIITGVPIPVTCT